MFIEEIIVEGFKSYATRTVIAGFDPHFNAITGLNGSGKSNILDAICFVLGISNLSQVRVGNLQELVYKQGQAGVTKATVTVIFNNADSSLSPVGYEQYKQITITRQIAIGGRNKYMINGHTAQQQQVQNLFHSVQLNVNNPHFLIMQGRITKVLNMKPPEILSMIEEAAGTRMFENKKQAALKTIEKKQTKVEEINRVLAEEITPTLDKLRNERAFYMKWTSNNTEIERLERFVVAYEFSEAERRTNCTDGEGKQMQDELQVLVTQINEAEQTVAEKDEQIRELMAAREGEMGTRFRRAKEHEQDLSKEVVKANSSCTNKRQTLEAEEANMGGLMEQAASTTTLIQEKEHELSTFDSRMEAHAQDMEAKQQQVNMLQTRFQNMCAGIAGGDEDDDSCRTLPGQIAALEAEAARAEASIHTSEMRKKHAQTAVKDLRKRAKAAGNDYTRLKEEHDAAERDLQSILERIGELKYDEDEVNRLESEKASEEKAVEECRDRVDRLSAQVEGRLNFEFSDPERGFDRRRVKGLVAKLIRVEQPQAGTALEVAAGAKLYQVVVDTEQTAKLLLQKGRLTKRVTIIPLNKVSHRVMDANRVRKAGQIASRMGGTAQLALELVGFDEEVRAAMEYVFGTTLVCDSMEVARAVTFDRDIRQRTVTLEGDSVDPSGTLSGGSRNSLGNLLNMIQELAAAQEELETRTARLQKINRRLQAIGKSKAEFATLNRERSLKQHALEMAKERIGQTAHGQLLADLQEKENELASLEQLIQQEAATLADCRRKLDELRSAEADYKNKRDAAMERVQQQLRDAQKAFSEAKAIVANGKQQKGTLKLEIESLKAELKQLQDSIAACRKTIQKLQAELAETEGLLADKRAEYQEAQEALQALEQELSQCSKEIKLCEKHKKDAEKHAEHCRLEHRKLAHKLAKFQKDAVQAEKLVESMLRKYAWIAHERQYFGQPQSDYDFAARDVRECQHRLRDLKAEQENISKKINKKVMGMIEKAEAEYQDLIRKKEVIENDKRKIENVIEELDVKKTQALQTTWVKVNRDFGSIFSTLLPGTAAKLEPPENGTVMDGLEVKVAFGGVWKESLTELSGGQRSLLALSLILSLLLFKPAPMYILDEVDAALDLSHTQNIGAMLRTHFSNSQFIVVSLKEGMFNNANVIFRTRFVDGVSTVVRTLGSGGRGGALPAPASAEAEEENGAPRKRGKKAAGAASRGRPRAAEDIENEY